LFWRDLSEAGLIAGSFTYSGALFLNNLTTAAEWDQYLPRAAIGNNNYIAVFGSSFTWGAQCNPGFCYAIINNPQDGSAVVFGTSISPGVAYAMDSKADDGLPRSGRITASALMAGAPGAFFDIHMTTNYTRAVLAGGPYCYNQGVDNTYLLGTSHVDIPECLVNFKSM
jgi:hypothetical protein